MHIYFCMLCRDNRCFFFFHQLQAYALILFMGSLCLAFLFYMKNSAVLSSTGMYASIMQDYQRMLEEIEHADVTSAFLQQLKKDCAQADHAILKLQHILQMVQVRNNFILHFIVNGFYFLIFNVCSHWKIGKSAMEVMFVHGCVP